MEIETNLLSSRSESYLSNLDRRGFFLTCPQPPSGHCHCSCYNSEKAREERAASWGDQATFLVLLQLLAFPSQAESDTSLPRAESEKSRELFQGQQRSAPTTTKVVGLLSCKTLVQKRHKHGYNSANECSLANFILVPQYMLIARLL